jgi:penicillin-binding protein 2
MSVIHAPAKRELNLREAMPLVLVLAALFVLFTRLWYLQVVRGDDLSEKARALRTNNVIKLAPRGLIFDRNGTMVAGIQPEIVVTAQPAAVKKNPWVLAKVSNMIGVPVEKLQDKVQQHEWRPHLPAPLHVGVPIEVAARIVESADSLPGIGVETQPMRFYPDTISLCHMLGYVWTPNDRDVRRLGEAGIEPAEYVGKDGLERIYEKDLMGEVGSETLEFDAKRRPLRVVGRAAPVPGAKLVLGIDLKLQQLGQQLLGEKRGAIVALEPKTGNVICMVSSPGFDAALFQKGISTQNWQMLLNDPGKPLINRAIGSRYSPGSTFKILVTLAAMEKGIFSPSATTVCRGYYQIGARKSRCLGVHGAISFQSAFARSCNTYFSDLAVRIGPEKLKEVARKAGLGERTGIDLPSEDTGLIPSAEWHEKHEGRKWSGGDTVNMGIGQGATAATPLQMACLVALVANEGIAYRPHVVRSTAPPGSNDTPKPVLQEELAKLDLPLHYWKELKQAMVGVIQAGTARVAQIPGIIWGGKTGSAEHRKAEQTHSWFVATAPMENPQISICVIVEAAGHGSTVAAPIARDIVRAYLSKPPAGSIAAVTGQT